MTRHIYMYSSIDSVTEMTSGNLVHGSCMVTLGSGLAQEHNAVPWPGLELGPSDPESSALTISPQRLAHSFRKMRVIFRNHIRWTVILDFWALTFNARIDSGS